MFRRASAAAVGPTRVKRPRLIRLAELLVPQRPAPWTAGGLGVLCSVLTALFVTTLAGRRAPTPAIGWTLSGVCGTLVFAGALHVLALALRRETFGPRWRWQLAAKLYGGLLVAGVVAAAVELGLRMWLALPVRFGVMAFLAHAAWFWLVGLAANAFGALRRRVADQDVVLRERGRDLDHTRTLLVRADERVRREAAEVLHGRVQSRLLASQMRLERIARELPDGEGEAGNELAEVIAVLDDLRVNDVRATSHLLHPPTVRISLLSALRSLVATFEGLFAIEVQLVASSEVVDLDDPTEGSLDEATRLVFYRVLEEALQNAHRHGHASTVTAELSLVTAGRLQMRVTDDGVGFDPDQFTIGLGVASIAARVEDSGGAWWIASTPGGGTTVTALVPLPVRDASRDVTPP